MKNAVWNRARLEAELCKLGLRKAQASDLGFHCDELRQICDLLPLETEALCRGAMRARRDSRTLALASHLMLGEFEHFRYHMTRATRIIQKLCDVAESLPPLAKGSRNAGKGMSITEALWKLDTDADARRLCGLDARYTRLIRKTRGKKKSRSSRMKLRPEAAR